eukprot:jgi/Botrbrau1/23581/Bobra.0141s0045.1
MFMTLRRRRTTGRTEKMLGQLVGLSFQAAFLPLLESVKASFTSAYTGGRAILRNWEVYHPEQCIQWSYVVLIGGSQCSCNLLTHDNIDINVNSGSQEYMYSVRSLHETSWRLLSFIRYDCQSSHDIY